MSERDGEIPTTIEGAETPSRRLCVLREGRTCANTGVVVGVRGNRLEEPSHGSSSFRHRNRRDRTRGRTGIGAGGLSLARNQHHQRVSARRAQRYRDAAAGRRHGADPQAAGRDRDQGRRCRTGRCAGRRLRQARRLHLAVAQRRHLRLRRGRQAVRPSGQGLTRRLHPARAPDRGSDPAPGQRPAALQDAEGVHRRRQGQSRHARFQLRRSLWSEPSAAGVSGKGHRLR